MARIAQQFDRLQVCVGQRVGGRHHIAEQCDRARLQHPARLAQAGVEIKPVMGGQPAYQQIEGAIGKGQMLGPGLARGDVGQAAAPGFAGHGLQHSARQVAGDDRADMRRDRIGGMAAAAAEVERPGARHAGGNGGQPVEIGAGGVGGAGHIGRGARAELTVDQRMLGRGRSSCHGGPIACWRAGLPPARGTPP
jgi:hypothetical protein